MKPQERMMIKKWEYKVVKSEPNLNTLGLEGWELVFILDGGGDYPAEWTFKRPLAAGESDNDN